jgi:hypothetical protein
MTGMRNSRESSELSEEWSDTAKLPDRPSLTSSAQDFISEWVLIEEARREFKETFELFAKNSLSSREALIRQLNALEHQLSESAAQFEEIQAAGLCPMDSLGLRVELRTSMRSHQWTSLMLERADYMHQFYTSVVEQLELFGPLQNLRKQTSFWGARPDPLNEVLRPRIDEFVAEKIAEVNRVFRARWYETSMGEEEAIRQAIAKFGSKRLRDPEKEEGNRVPGGETSGLV